MSSRDFTYRYSILSYLVPPFCIEIANPYLTSTPEAMHFMFVWLVKHGNPNSTNHPVHPPLYIVGLSLLLTNLFQFPTTPSEYTITPSPTTHTHTHKPCNKLVLQAPKLVCPEYWVHPLYPPSISKASLPRSLCCVIFLPRSFTTLFRSITMLSRTDNII